MTTYKVLPARDVENQVELLITAVRKGENRRAGQYRRGLRTVPVPMAEDAADQDG